MKPNNTKSTPRADEEMKLWNIFNEKVQNSGDPQVWAKEFKSIMREVESNTRQRVSEEVREIKGNDLWQSMSDALEEDFGKIDTSTINWWDKILIRIKIWTGLL